MGKLIYIHGLNSSCGSNTGRLLKREFGDRLLCLDLLNNPRNWGGALEGFFAGLDRTESYTVLGSSLGGFFALYLAEKYSYRLILVNPVLDYRDLRQFIGSNENFATGEKWQLTEEDVDVLAKYQNVSSVPDLLLLGKNDELLDYRDALEIYRGKARIILTEDRHQFDLAPFLDDVKSTVPEINQ